MRFIVKETYGWASASPARPATPPPASSSAFQYVLHANIKGKISGNINQIKQLPLRYTNEQD